jgi:hypothetical protein
MIFEITKPITVTLKVNCNTKEEAAAWANKIVANIEDDEGNLILSNEFIDFEAETITSAVKIVQVKF